MLFCVLSKYKSLVGWLMYSRVYTYICKYTYSRVYTKTRKKLSCYDLFVYAILYYTLINKIEREREREHLNLSIKVTQSQGGV